MRPNYAQDAPPTTIMVGGYAYPANVDYRVWLDVMKCMRNMYSDPATDEQASHNAEIIDEIQTLVFGGVLADENISETIHAIVEFSKGYPTAKNDHEPETGPQVVSFDYDLNYIIIAIRNQSGIDLSYRRKEPFHWWEFLLEFQTLCGDHYILNIMEARSYTGKDKDALKRKRMCALPVEHTLEEQEAYDAFNAIFEGGEHDEN